MIPAMRELTSVKVSDFNFDNENIALYLVVSSVSIMFLDVT